MNQCKADEALQILTGKWTHAIIFQLSTHQTLRFNELKNAIPMITQKVLTQQLKELEWNEIITRTVYPEVPPRVEYTLSEYGAGLLPVLKLMDQWGQEHARRMAEKEAQSSVTAE